MKKIITIIAALALLALACGEEENTPPPGPNLLSPNGVLDTIEYAFNHHDQPGAIDTLKSALSPQFVFYFNPTDVGDIVNGYQIPESWTYTEFWTACRNMFNEAYEITLGIPQIGAPGPNAAEFFAGNVTINLLVMMDESTGYRADTGYCDFKFKKQGDGTWRLVAWWDHTSSGRAGGSPSSFGRVLAMYH